MLAPVHFIAVNQTTLSGGHRKLEATLSLRGVESDSRKQSTISFPFVCFDADIGINADLLLSYAWLAASHVDIHPKRHGLAVIQRNRHVWVAGAKEGIGQARMPSHVGVIAAKAKDGGKPQRSEGRTRPKDYTVRRQFFDEIVRELGLMPTVDGFASPTNNRVSRFFTQEQDALKQPWGSGDTMWLNPPWVIWPQVAERLARERCAAIVICPAWTKPWVKQLTAMASRRIYFEAGTSLHEVDGRPVPSTKWGTWALRVDKGPRKTFDPQAPLKHVFFSPSWRPLQTMGQRGGQSKKSGEPKLEAQEVGGNPSSEQRKLSRVSFGEIQEEEDSPTQQVPAEHLFSIGTTQLLPPTPGSAIHTSTLSASADLHPDSTPEQINSITHRPPGTTQVDPRGGATIKLKPTGRSQK